MKHEKFIISSKKVTVGTTFMNINIQILLTQNPELILQYFCYTANDEKSSVSCMSTKVIQIK